MQVQPGRDKATLVDLIDRILDKGLVVNADIQVTLCGVELLGIRIRAVLASFETATRYGLEFPFGTAVPERVRDDAHRSRDSCPECGKRGLVEELLAEGCPWCGWQSARVLAARGLPVAIEAGL